MKLLIPNDTYNAHQNNLLNAKYYENFALLFRNYVPWRKDDFKFDENKWVKFEDFKFNNGVLNQLQTRGNAIMYSFKQLGFPTLQFSMRTTWRLITGIGASSALEVGMILHHVYGIPYIPSSSIKGLLRFYLTKVKPSSDLDVDTLLGYSNNDKSAKGEIVFLDAFPQPGFKISVDIMNNHYQDYYMGDKPPADWMVPNPVKFLTVKNATFVFRMFANNKVANENILGKVAQSLSFALTDLGIGAKTAVGYGRLDHFQKMNLSQPLSDVQDKNDIKSLNSSKTFNFYDSPDGTKEYYLKRLDTVEPYSEKVQWLFQKWEHDKQWKNNPDIAKAFLPKIKKEKKSGKETYFFKVIKSILGQ